MYTVLYVDDEEDLLDLARLFLERSPEFSVKTQTSAQAALDSPLIATCDVIVSDYQMPGMDGIAFLKAVREKSKTLPFILFTGRGREEVVIEAINNGVDFYLQKGGDPKSQFAELSHKIRMAVERKQAVDERIDSEKRLSSIFHASPIHQMITDPATGKILDINDQFLHDLKLSRSEVIGRTLEEIGLVVDPVRYLTIMERMGEEGTVRNAELNIRARNGRTYTTLISLTRVQVHNQDLIYTQSMDITAQKKAQQTINALLNAPPDVSFLINTRGVILAANHAAEVRYGLPVQSLIGMDACTLISPNLADLRRMKIEETIATRKPLVYLDDRTGRSYENHLYPVTGPDGEVAAVAIHSHDITEERKAKEALKESEEKYRLLVEHSHDSIYIYRGNHFLFINRQAEELSGFSHEELMKREIWDFIHPDDRERLKEAAVKRLAGGHVSSSFEARILRKNGEVREGEFYVDLIDFLGQPAILGIVRDITEKKRAEEAIREREEQLRSLSDNLPSGMVYQIIIEPDGKRRFVHVSAGVERIHGVTAGEVIRDSSLLYDQVVTEDRLPLKEAEDRALASMSPLSFEARIRTPSGTERWVLLRSAPRPLSGHGIIWDGIELDITAAKRAEEELKAACEHLTASQEGLKGQFDALKAGQDLLRESEEKYRTLVEHTEDGVFIGQDGILLFVNQAFSTLTGHEAGELIGQPFAPLVAPEDREMVLSRHNIRLGGNSPPETYEFSLLHRNGTTRVRVKIRVGAGTYAGRPAAIGTLHNVTEDLRKETALAESEELHRSLFMASPDGIAMVDTKGILTYVSPKALEMFGLSLPEEAIGTHVLDWMTDVDRRLAGERLAKVLSDNSFVSQIYHVHRKDGSPFIVEMHSAALHNSNGSVRGIISILRDITDRKQAEDELRTSEENYRHIIENMQDVFYRVNREGIITMISPYGARLVGFDSPDEIIGKYSATDFYADPKERDEFLAHLSREHKVSGYPLTLRDRNGGLHYAIASSRLLYDAHGKMDGVEGFLHDVTHLKQVENALRKANRQITLMTSITRHDIRNQLMALNGWLELSRASVDDPERMRDLITREQQIAEIIGNQIDFTTFFDEMGVKPPTWQDLAALIRIPAAALPFNAVRLEIDLPDIALFGDPLLEKVFYNLFDNSLRYGGEGMTAVRVSSLQDGATLTLVVEDNGTGILEKDKGLLFDRGFGKNTGLGLFLVKEILGITGMTIRETGIPGKGVRFEIQVPAGKFRVVGTGLQRS